RGPARDRLVAADRQAQGGDAGELAAGRGRDHRRLRLRRRGEGDVPGGLEVTAALHPDRAAAALSRGLFAETKTRPLASRDETEARAKPGRPLDRRRKRAPREL